MPAHCPALLAQRAGPFAKNAAPRAQRLAPPAQSWKPLAQASTPVAAKSLAIAFPLQKGFSFYGSRLPAGSRGAFRRTQNTQITKAIKGSYSLFMAKSITV
jgi:hypothetical protein